MPQFCGAGVDMAGMRLVVLARRLRCEFHARGPWNDVKRLGVPTWGGPLHHLNSLDYQRFMLIH